MQNLDDDQKRMILKALEGPVTKAVRVYKISNAIKRDGHRLIITIFLQAGEEIILQGDHGDMFYVLEEGTVDVFVKKGGAEEALIHTYEAGSTFGELALLYGSPRAATCRAATDCVLWTLDRLSFRVSTHLGNISFPRLLTYY